MTKTKKTSAGQLKKALSKLPTKSAQIRYLDSIGHTRSDISKVLTDFHGKLVRYQHVRNVLITPVTAPKK